MWQAKQVDGPRCKTCRELAMDCECVPSGPRYVWNDNCGHGERNSPWAKRLTDANGLEWDKVLWCNVETGEMERFVTDDDGMFVVENNELKVEFVTAAAPLTIEWGR